jgi:hypothetical protein
MAKSAVKTSKPTVSLKQAKIDAINAARAIADAARAAIPPKAASTTAARVNIEPIARVNPDSIPSAITDQLPKTVVLDRGKPSEKIVTFNKPGRQPKGEQSARDMVLAMFADKDREWSTTNIVETVLARNPAVKENSIRFVITTLKNDGYIREMRRDGRVSILKASETAPVPSDMVRVPRIAPKTVRRSQASSGELMALLKDLAALVGRIQTVAAKQSAQYEQLEKVRALLG